MNDSSWARVVGVLFSPTRTFELIRQRPTWLVALAVLVLLSAVTGYLVTQKLDMEQVVREATSQGGRQLSEDQLETAIELQEKFGSIFALIGPLIFFPVGCLLTALLFWVALKLLGAELSYKASFATTMHGLMPSAVAALLALPVILSRAEFAYEDVQTGSILASSLAFLASEDTTLTVKALLASFDVFSIWSVVLLTIGYSVVGRVSRGKAAATVIVLWAAWVLIKVGWISIAT